MGLCNAPRTFQQIANTMMAFLINKGVQIYLDDIVIYSRTKEEHEQLPWHVFEILQKQKFQVKISKCKFFAKRLKYLGHVVSKDGVQANPAKLAIIREYPRPLSKASIMSFIGLCSYFRRYVKNFFHIARPLKMLLKKNVPFVWTESQRNAFEALKKALAEEVTLAFPDFSQMFIVTTDASEYAIGGVLTQRVPYERPIYFYSRTLTDTERMYSVIQKELTAICDSIKAFRVYLYVGLPSLI